MTGFLDNGLMAGGVDIGDNIANSLRTRRSDSAYLSRTFGTPTDNKKYTISFCGRIADVVNAMGWISNVTTTSNVWYIHTNNTLRMHSAGSVYFTSTEVIRDPTKFYHWTIQCDSANATTANRIVVYKNNVLLGGQTCTLPQNTTGWHASGSTARIGNSIGWFGDAKDYADWLISMFILVDGQLNPPSDFGRVSADTGAWVPKTYTGTYGANGFKLDFSDGTSLTTLGYDSSGNSNHWTLNNVSLTTGVTYDWLTDTPTNTFATLNPLNQSVSTNLSNCNLTHTTGVANWNSSSSSMSVVSGKLYWEVTIGATSANGTIIGISGQPRTFVGGGTELSQYSDGYGYYITNGHKRNNNVGSVYGATAVANDVIGVALDLDAGTLVFYKNNTSQGIAFSSLSGTFSPAISIYDSAQYSNLNFGQRPFAYTPPTGFLALNTANMPTPAILRGDAHFQIELDTGANIKTTAEAVFPSGFLEWIKDRANANNHQLIDSVRGTSAVLQSNTTAAETTYTAPSGSSAAWVWNMGTSTVTNTNGSISAQVMANAIAGQSIVTYTGNGTASATVGHGLGVAPAMTFIKNRAGTNYWIVWHKSLASHSYNMYLQDTSSAQNDGNFTALPSSTLLTLDANKSVNVAATNYVAHCFAEVPGYSKLTSATLNGSADGNFIDCGGSPAYILAKCISTTSDWFEWDVLRSPDNPMNEILYANTTSAEVTTGFDIDATSTGFKIRTAQSGDWVFYVVLANPTKYSNGR